MANAAAGSRYDVLLKLASGGMATVYIGQVRGALGFRQLVAIKRPHAHLLDDATFRAELLAEARLASMISHANVVDVRDVEVAGESIDLVMDYIEGASLGDLLVAASRDGRRISPRVAVRVALDACAGLHAAHELVDERGRPVSLVHRDVSPQNILVGTDGNARVVDFGVAKFARKNLPSTSGSTLKGKLAYMSPEYVRGEPIDRRFDVFALGVVLWEALTGKRLFRGANEVETLKRIVDLAPEPPSAVVPELGTALDDLVLTAMAKRPEERFQNAAAMGAALERTALAAGLLGGASDVVAELKALVGPAIEERRALVRAKLAHEPSVASLMGVPPLVAEQLAAAVAAHEQGELVAGDGREGTARISGAPTVNEPRAAMAFAGVAPSAAAPAPVTAPAPPSNPPPLVATLASVPDTTVGSYTLLSPSDPSTASVTWTPPRRRGWLVPAVAFASVLVATVGTGAVVLRRGTARAPASAEVPAATGAASLAPSTAPVVSATASSSPAAPAPSPPVAASASPVASASGKPAPLVRAPAAGARAPHAKPASTPVTGAGAGRRPPDNPYE